MLKKKSISELMKQSKTVVSEELLKSISGGTENACHDHPEDPKEPTEIA